MISPNMREINRSDSSQWIPWEVSFSLKETTRSDRTSHSNAMLAIVLPDRNGSYDYYLTKNCCDSTTHHIDKLFKIIRENKFNIKSPNKIFCRECNNYHYFGSCSYIKAIKWSDFINSPNNHIEQAIERQTNIEDYEITKDV